MSLPLLYLMKEYFYIVQRRIKMDLDWFQKISNHTSILLMMSHIPQGNQNLLDMYSFHNHCYLYHSYRYFHNNPINKSHLDQQTGEIQAHFLHPPPIHHHMNNLHMIPGFIPMIQKNPMVGTLLGILHWQDMNHMHNEIHHLYPFSGIIHLLHTLENNQLTNLLHIEWSYHLLIWLLEETSQIPIINLAFGIDINTSNSWLAIIQNIYYWKEMK